MTASERDLSPAPAPIFPVFLVVLVDVFGMTLVIPLLAIYAERFGATPFKATLLVSVFAACQLVSGPLIGAASDRVGRKPMLLVSQLGTFLGFLLLARAHALWVVYLSRAVDGATAGNISLAQAYISDHTEPENRAESFALIGIAFGLGFFVGPSLTGVLAHAYGLTAPIYVAAAMSFLSIVATATLLQGGPPAARAEFENARKGDADPGPGGRRLAVLDWGQYAGYFAKPVLGGVLLQFFAFMLAFTLFTSGFALFAERRLGWTPREIGFLFGYVGFLGILLQGGLIGRLVKRFGERQLVAAGFASLVLGYLLLGAVHTVALLVLTATISAFGNGVLRPALTSLITQNAGRHEQGTVLGLTQSLTSIAAILSPMLGGALIGHGKLSLWAWTAGLASAGGLWLAGNSLASYGGGPLSAVAPQADATVPPMPEAAAGVD